MGPARELPSHLTERHSQIYFESDPKVTRLSDPTAHIARDFCAIKSVVNVSQFNDGENMSDSTHLTVGDIAEFFGEPQWKVRRIVDSLPDEIPRAGRYRLIPRSLLAVIGERLQSNQNRETVVQ